LIDSHRDNLALLDEEMKKAVSDCSNRASRLWERTAIATLDSSGIDPKTIAWFVERDLRTVHRWIGRIHKGHDLYDDKRSGRPPIYDEELQLKTIAFYCGRAPAPGYSEWSFRDAETYLKNHPKHLDASPSHETIRRILRNHALRPHLHKYFLQITDPNFFPKAEAIIALYLDPPEHLYCYDECTCIQALKRLSPDLPVAPNHPNLEDYVYDRKGIRDLMAFLAPTTGNVTGECTPNHNTKTLCRVFTNHVRSLPPDAVIHYIMDNLNTHINEDFCKTIAKLCKKPYPSLETGEQRRQWLQSDDKRIIIHFLPTHASWLNMVEIWFGIFKSKCLNHGSFGSVEMLSDAIEAFLQTWNEHFAHPFKWSYTGEGLHKKAVRRFCKLLFIESKDMDAKFLTSQLLLMCNLAKSYRELVPEEDWANLVKLVTEKAHHIMQIITEETGPRRRPNAEAALAQFHETFCQAL